MVLAQVVAQPKVNHRFLPGQDPFDVAFVPVEDYGGQNPGHQGQDPVVFAQCDNEDGGDPDDAGHAGHARQKEGADKDQAGDSKQGRVVGQQYPGTGSDGLATVEVVKNGNGVAQGGKDPDQKGIDAGTDSPEVGLAGRQGPL